VPYRVVGLVVGPKGATIKRIQQQTSTYIVTPSREKEPIFEVTGMPDNVEQAKREIEAHIALRTGLVNVDGSGNELSPDMIHDLAAGLNGLGLGMLGSSLGGALDNGATDLMGSLYKTSSSALRSAFSGHHHNLNNDVYGVASSGLSNLLGDNAFGLRSHNSYSNAPSAAAGKMDSELQTLGSGLLNSLYDSDEGIGLGGSDSPTLSHSLIQPNIWSTDFGTGLVGGGSTSSINTNSTSSATANNGNTGAKRSNSFGFPTSDSDHPPARRISSDPLTAIGSTLNSLSAAFQIRSDSDSGVRDSSASASGSASPAACSPVGSSSNSSTRGSLKRECIMCCEGEMVAALVPCGHKLFCMDCAQSLVPKESSAESDVPSTGGECPVCHQSVTQAIRIFS
jgi:RNA-binding protein MEX3